MTIQFTTKYLRT